ncbi:hypothetical protein [Chryseobacterium sp. OV279]|uniref:hypothetical protein n=1 Tax=Chryseobacterium sp. OV279 TaxID=1500285 RepID=UPI00091508A6|nr:hypothetical protein [Chryseobacterium sp. OV279]SHE76968.1 hypothetical protein SAMN02787100_0800 [Chryseobacterium sp. OV279]
MKKLLLLFFVLSSVIKVSACKCVRDPLPQEYLNANVVGVIKIIKVYDENIEQRTYKADVEFEKLYKGTEFKTLTVRGLIGNSHSAACEIDIEPNERYLILLSGAGSNSYTISSCTPKSKLSARSSKDENSELENLKKTFSYLDKNRYKFTGLTFTFCEDGTSDIGQTDLSKIKDFQPKQSFAIYRVKINESSKIDEIVTITGFGSQDKIIEDVIKRKMIVDRPMFSNSSDKKEFLILLFYHKKNSKDQYKNIISNYW